MSLSNLSWYGWLFFFWGTTEFLTQITNNIRWAIRGDVEPGVYAPSVALLTIVAYLASTP